MFLNHIEFDNFKSIRHGAIKFKKINLLLGANNSGKSSLIQSLLLLKQTIESRSAETPLVFEGPYVNFQSVKKPIRVPSDLKGQKIRVMESQSIHETVRVAGGTPTPIPWPEIYTSMQQGVIDGMGCPLPFVRMAKVDEIIKYINKADFYLAFSNLHVCEKFYQSLSSEDKYLLKKCALEAMRIYDGMVLFAEKIEIDYFKSKGIEVYYPTAQEMALWRKTIGPHMIEWTKKKIGAEWVDRFVKASAQAEKELYGD